MPLELGHCLVVADLGLCISVSCVYLRLFSRLCVWTLYPASMYRGRKRVCIETFKCNVIAKGTPTELTELFIFLSINEGSSGILGILPQNYFAFMLWLLPSPLMKWESEDLKYTTYYIISVKSMKIEMMVSSFLFGLKALVNSTDKMYMLNYWRV